jgi:hypothetical protein
VLGVTVIPTESGGVVAVRVVSRWAAWAAVGANEGNRISDARVKKATKKAATGRIR